MKKIILFIVLCLAIIPNVKAKTYSSYNIGDKVTLSKGSNTTTGWYVIKNSDSSSDTVELLREWNVSNELFNLFVTTNVYDDSTIKKLVILHGYQLSLGDYLKEIRLLTREELRTLGCTTSSCSGSKYSWTHSISYWLSDASTDLNKAYRVYSSDGTIGTDTVTNSSGLRPVIVVSKEAITGGYTNDERTFEGIDITCNKELKSNEDFECYIKIDKEIQQLNFNLKIEGLSILEKYKIENVTWNEQIEFLDNEGIYEQTGITLTKLSGQEDSDILLKITGTAKELKEDSSIKLTFTNIKMMDSVGDYQNIDNLEKELTFAKQESVEETKEQAVIKNPKTGIVSIAIVLVIIALFSGLVYFMINKYSKKIDNN